MHVRLCLLGSKLSIGEWPGGGLGMARGRPGNGQGEAWEWPGGGLAKGEAWEWLGQRHC